MKKVEPKILPGFMELLPEDQIAFNKMYDTIRNVYESFGYLPLDTPTIEYSKILLAKAGGETEKQIYRFLKGDTDLSLRFDLTVPLARYVSEHYNDLAFPFKRYQMSKVFRGERPQKGRFREFYQCDIDVIGNGELDIAYDAEIPSVIYHVFKELNIGQFTIKINNRKVLNGFFDFLNLKDKVTDILRIIDKIDKIGVNSVIEELLDLDINKNDTDKIINFISINGSSNEIINKLKDMDVTNDLFNDGIIELEEVVNYLDKFNIPETNYKIDLTIARGLDYYTGTVYETSLNDYPKLGSICSGGRYDNLTEYYSDEKLPGIGISIGLTRLFSQLKEENIISSTKKSLIDILIIPMDKAYMDYAINIASILRQDGIITDTYYLDKSMKNKMKFANRLNIPYVIIIGEEEYKTKTATLKNMITGEQKTLNVNEIIKKIGEQNENK